MAAGSPLGLELEDASLGNVHRLRELSKGSHIIEEGGLDLGFPFPKCTTSTPHLPVPLSPLCPRGVG